MVTVGHAWLTDQSKHACMQTIKDHNVIYTVNKLVCCEVCLNCVLGLVCVGMQTAGCTHSTSQCGM